MTLSSLGRPYGAKYRVYFGSTTGPSSYSSGGFTVTIDNVSKIDNVVVMASGGYLAEASASGNTITIKVYYFNYPATAAGVAEEVAAGTDLSGVTFRIIAICE